VICCFISTTITEELHREKKYARLLIAGSGHKWDLSSWEQDRIRTKLLGTGTGVERMLVVMGESGNGELVLCNTLI